MRNVFYFYNDLRMFPGMKMYIITWMYDNFKKYNIYEYSLLDFQQGC